MPGSADCCLAMAKQKSRRGRPELSRFVPCERELGAAETLGAGAMRQPGRVVRGGLVWVVRGTHYLGEVLSRSLAQKGPERFAGLFS